MVLRSGAISPISMGSVAVLLSAAGLPERQVAWSASGLFLVALLLSSQA